MKFLILGLPRSRTFWLSRFLSYGTHHCGHEEIRHLRGMADVESWFAQDDTGSAETAGAPWWRLIPADVRVAVIRRPPSDVIDSLMRIDGVTYDRAVLERSIGRLDAKLDQIEARRPGVLSVSFDSLDYEAVCARVFEHCLPYRHDPGWWRALASVNLQVPMVALQRHMRAHWPQLEKMASTAKQVSLRQLMARSRVEMEGVTFQQERFDPWFRDAQSLFQEHMVATGQAPGDQHKKNLTLLRLLDRHEALQITTARCNGRMLGYLMAVVGPSLDAQGVIAAENLPFFVSQDAPGIGMKLQRASVEALRDRGVGEVLMRAGVRGSGPRLGAMYRRMGAEDMGRLYKLPLTVGA